MPEIVRKVCADAELATLEDELRAKGYSLTSKNSDKELKPMEYMKSSHHGDAQHFEGPKMWTVTWRVA